MRLALLILASTPLATPALAQDPHAGHQTSAAPAAPRPPAKPAPDPHAGHVMPAAPVAADPHAGHAMPAAPADPHAGHAMATTAPKTAAHLPVGGGPPPPPPMDNAADRVFGAAPMAAARGVLRAEHGGGRVAKVMADLLEYSPEGDGYRWEGEAWYGGDINRFVFKTEGEGRRGGGTEEAEVQALYSRAVARYTDVQAGVRYDFEPRGRAYLTVGVESLFPYWFEADVALFLSDRGDLLARIEGSTDLRFTQRLILQPRAELDFAAQDVRETGVGSGLSTAEFGLRLRYEIRREFAPFVGVSYTRRLGQTADFARAAGEHLEETRFIFGVRAWF